MSEDYPNIQSVRSMRLDALIANDQKFKEQQKEWEVLRKSEIHHSQRFQAACAAMTAIIGKHAGLYKEPGESVRSMLEKGQETAEAVAVGSVMYADALLNRLAELSKPQAEPGESAANADTQEIKP